MATQRLGEFWDSPRLDVETGTKKSFRYKAERAGKFPRRIKVGRRSVWSSVQVEQWKRCMAEGKEWRQEDMTA